jgi:hypothetical protein
MLAASLALNGARDAPPMRCSSAGARDAALACRRFAGPVGAARGITIDGQRRLGYTVIFRPLEQAARRLP